MFFPEDLIVAGTYQCVPNIRQDKDPKRDMNGILHRAVVSSRPSTIKFQVKEIYTADKARIKAFFDACMTNAAQRKVRVRFWDTENDVYKTEYMYLPDVTYTVLYHTQTDVLYGPLEYELIGYGT